MPRPSSPVRLKPSELDRRRLRRTLGWRSAPERSAALDAPLLDMVARQSGHRWRKRGPSLNCATNRLSTAHAPREPTPPDAFRNVAQFLRSEIREEDEIARWGGEEFLLVVRELPERSLESLLDRLRRTWDAHCPDLTFSMGAAIVGADSDSVATFAAAGRALYAAKRAGRDHVVVQSGV